MYTTREQLLDGHGGHGHCFRLSSETGPRPEPKTRWDGGNVHTRHGFKSASCLGGPFTSQQTGDVRGPGRHGAARHQVHRELTRSWGWRLLASGTHRRSGHRRGRRLRPSPAGPRSQLCRVPVWQQGGLLRVPTGGSASHPLRSPHDTGHQPRCAPPRRPSPCRSSAGGRGARQPSEPGWPQGGWGAAAAGAGRGYSRGGTPDLLEDT